MLKIFPIILIGMLTGCGSLDKTTAQLTGYSNHCIDGVSYIQFTNGASVKYNPDGTIFTC